MSTTVTLGNIVGKRVDIFLEGVVPLHRYFYCDAVFPFPVKMEYTVQRRLVLVEVFDEQGNKLGQTKTDSDGFFTYTPTSQVNHVFRADLGAGHIAKTVFDISELSSVLTGDELAQNTGETAKGTGDDPNTAPGDVTITQQQEILIAAIVRDELRPLRREITAYKEKNDFQSILGGIGYIFGFFGIAYYLSLIHI